MLAHRFNGKRFDCGSKLGYLKATVEFALRHPEVATQFEAYLTHPFAGAGRLNVNARSASRLQSTDAKKGAVPRIRGHSAFLFWAPG